MRGVLTAIVMGAAGSVVMAQPSAAQPLIPPTTAPARSEPGLDRGKVDLRPKFRKGSETRFVMNIESDDSTKMTKTDETARTVKQEIGLTLRCVDADAEKGATLEMVFDSFKLDMKAPTGDVSFDSTKPTKDDDVMAEVMKSIVGLKQRVVVDPEGNISSVSGGADAAAGALLGQFTGADLVQNVFGPIFSLKKGGGTVSVGEKWTTEDTIEGAGAKTRVRMTHSVTSLRGSKATVDLSGSVTIDPKSSGGPMPAVKDSSIAGQATWDTEAGMLSALDVRQTLVTETSGSEGAAVRRWKQTVKVVRK